MDQVFVYGTLKKGFGNHGVLTSINAKYLERATTRECYPLIDQGLPFLIHAEGQGYQVEGEIYQVTSAVGWQALDELEGHPDFYFREIVGVIGEGGRVSTAWTYFVTQPDPGWRSLTALRRYERISVT